MLARQREVLERFGVRFDEWRSERELLSGGALDEAISRLRENGYVYETEGAVWLRSTALGDETDRPLLRSNGEPTYLAGDLAYHQDKLGRGFDRLIDVWGPDHQTYVRRTLAGVEALGFRPEALDIIVLGPVTLKIDGQLVESGAAGGNNLLLEEVIEEAGKQTARFFYLLRSAEAPLELDLDLVREQPADHPAARVLRALALAREAGASAPGAAAAVPDIERGNELHRLARRVADFPGEVRSAAETLDPSRLARYALEVADQVLVLPSTGPGSAPETATVLDAAAVVLQNALSILGCAESPD